VRTAGSDGVNVIERERSDHHSLVVTPPTFLDLVRGCPPTRAPASPAGRAPLLGRRGRTRAGSWVVASFQDAPPTYRLGRGSSGAGASAQWRPAAAASVHPPPASCPYVPVASLSRSSTDRCSLFCGTVRPMEHGPAHDRERSDRGPRDGTRAGSRRRAARLAAIGPPKSRPSCAARDDKGAPRPGWAR
jgi:hypothetical protein